MKSNHYYRWDGHLLNAYAYLMLVIKTESTFANTVSILLRINRVIFKYCIISIDYLSKVLKACSQSKPC